MGDYVEKKITGIEKDSIFGGESNYFNPHVLKVIENAEENSKEKLEDQRMICTNAICDFKKKAHEYLKSTDKKKGNNDPNSNVSKIKNAWFVTIYKHFREQLFDSIDSGDDKILRAAVLY